MTTAEFLLARKLGKGDSPSIVVEALNATENGTYTAPQGKAYSPVSVAVPDPVLDDITITENGVYTSEHDGFDEVTVEVPPPEDSYQLKSITTPTSLATFEASAMPMPSLKVSVEAKQEGSGVPSPDNVRPISGWSEVVVSDVGKNYYDGDRNVTGTGGTRIIPNNYALNLKSGTYTAVFKLNENPSSSASFQFVAWDADNNVVINTTKRLVTGENFITATAEVNITRVTIYTNNQNSGIYSDIMILNGDTPDYTYEPYQGTTTTISLGQTVYGAEVDVVNGTSGNKLTDVLQTITSVTRNSGTSYYVNTTQGTAKADNFTTIICDKLPTASDTSAVGVFVDSQGVIQINTPESYESASDMMQAYGGEINVRYELATPTTFTTQPTPIKSLNGINNLSVDSGDVIEGEYFIELGGE